MKFWNSVVHREFLPIRVIAQRIPRNGVACRMSKTGRNAGSRSRLPAVARTRGTDSAESPEIIESIKPNISMNATTEECIKICNSLLRGELSAIETYDQALEKYADTPAANELSRIRSDHSHAAARLATNVREMGGEPENESGAGQLCQRRAGHRQSLRCRLRHRIPPKR